MTEGGISKKVFFGTILAIKLADMAIAETASNYRIYYFFGLLALIPLYWTYQVIIDYLKDIKGKNKEVA